MDDDTAIKALRNSDKEAYTWIYNKYFHQLLSHAAKIVGYENAEDMVQDLFKILWVKRETIHITTSLRDYLHKSIHNICLNFHKQKKNEREHIEYALDTNDNSELLQVSDDNNPLSMLIAKEKTSRIEEVMAALPEHHRQVLELAVFEESGYMEISKKINIPLGSVGPRIIRAKKELLKLIENKG